VLDADTLMAAIVGAEGQHSRDISRDLPLKTAVLHKRRCSTRRRPVDRQRARRRLRAGRLLRRAGLSHYSPGCRRHGSDRDAAGNHTSPAAPRGTRSSISRPEEPARRGQRRFGCVVWIANFWPERRHCRRRPHALQQANAVEYAGVARIGSATHDWLIGRAISSHAPHRALSGPRR